MPNGWVNTKYGIVPGGSSGGVQVSKYVLAADCIKTPLGAHIKIAYIM